MNLIEAYTAWLADEPQDASDAAFIAWLESAVTVTTSPTWVTLRTLHGVLGSANAEVLIATLEGAVAPYKNYGASVEPVFTNCTWNGTKL